jgi:hypothetical protein
VGPGEGRRDSESTTSPLRLGSASVALPCPCRSAAPGFGLDTAAAPGYPAAQRHPAVLLPLYLAPPARYRIQAGPATPRGGGAGWRPPPCSRPRVAFGFLGGVDMVV